MSGGGAIVQLAVGSSGAVVSNKPHPDETFFKSECAKKVYHECVAKHNQTTFKKKNHTYKTQYICMYQVYQKCLEEELKS